MKNSMEVMIKTYQSVVDIIQFVNLDYRAISRISFMCMPNQEAQ